MAADWWSIEVTDGKTSANAWRDAYEYTLVEAAVTNGALMWDWHTFSWGLVFEVSFRDEADWEKWHRLPGVQAALDAVPDPIRGLLLHRGHGGTAGRFVPRLPTPTPLSAAAALPVPEPDLPPLPLLGPEPTGIWTR
ncbi:hypothetical protein [Yinghuangia seranimata]|uniref:hypothetical protein n=1 Tax=Yinghuangia seranimata TaxID=408067 RepID=UPI00248D0477|nr:hypothetical protein [Yinghuangia seranimata]MDI2131984.1 hypothetical protein [Yinghuangia seranimata]